jgi:hypothetical protein
VAEEQEGCEEAEAEAWSKEEILSIIIVITTLQVTHIFKIYIYSR